MIRSVKSLTCDNLIKHLFTSNYFSEEEEEYEEEEEVEEEAAAEEAPAPPSVQDPQVR